MTLFHWYYWQKTRGRSTHFKKVRLKERLSTIKEQGNQIINLKITLFLLL